MFPRFVEAFQQDIWAKLNVCIKTDLCFQACVFIVTITALEVVVTVSYFQTTYLQILQRWCCLLLTSTDD